MKNDEIKYYQFIGSLYDADEYRCPKPVRNKVYAENEQIGGFTAAYWALELSVDESFNEWKLVDKPKQAI
jgi:hypothetical protein